MQATPARRADAAHASGAVARKAVATPRISFATVPHAVIQRKCACGGSCPRCDESENVKLQRKLSIGASNDPLELEADRVADQVIAATPSLAVGSAPVRIQRLAAVPNQHAGTVPSSVGLAIAGSGRPLEPALQEDMEHRFGADFSGVRVHTDAVADRSARDVGAHAYTAGRNVVFASGQFDPGTAQGRRLLAHELTHVVQQSGTNTLPAARNAQALQRKPITFSVRPPIKNAFRPDASDDTELYFGRTDVCDTCHQADEADRFQKHAVKHERVTRSNIVEWAAGNVWGEEVLSHRWSRKDLFRMIQRRQDEKLNAIWNPHRQPTVAKVLPSIAEDLKRPRFIGSDEARNNWAVQLHVDWDIVAKALNQRIIDWLVRDIDAILHSQLLPAGSTLVAEPKEIEKVETQAERGSIAVADSDILSGKITVGFEWLGKRMLSVSPDHSAVFEMIDKEGIYFWISATDLRKAHPLMGRYVGEVSKYTKGMDIVGKFVKGLLTALASPVLMAIDTSAKVIDVTTQGVAALGEATGWYSSGFTCFSSTCQQYQQCVEDSRSPETCKETALEQALKEATVIIPMYEQGRECLEGDAEACGGIAALALGVAEERLTRLSEYDLEGAGSAKSPRPADGHTGHALTTAEFEDAAIREKIGRARPDAPHLAEGLEKPKVHQEAAAPSRPTSGSLAKHFEPVAKVPGLKAAVDAAAERFKIKPQRLEAEVSQLRDKAGDPGKVARPQDSRFDAEIKTSVDGEEHRFDREKSENASVWCRFSGPPGDCPVPVGPEVDKAVDAALNPGKGTKKAVAVPEKPLSQIDYAKTRKAAKKEFKYGEGPSEISGETGRHKDASVIRAGEGVSGKKVQSAHSAPSSIMKGLDDYSRENALTVHLEKGRHKSFDSYWKEWAQDQRRLGAETMTVQEFHTVMSEAIEQAPITDGQKAALFDILNREIEEFGLKPTDELDLPYPNYKPYKPGPELDALKAKIADQKKARLKDPERVAGMKQEKTRLRKDIAAYEAIVKRLGRDPKQRGTVEAYRLQIAKMKKQLNE